MANTATAAGTDPNGDDVTDDGSTTVSTVDKNGHVTIAKTTTSTPANGENYVLGETITYSIVAENDGNLTATDVVVTDELTGDSWTIESLEPGASETFTAEHAVTEEDILAGSVVNVATAKGTSPDPDEPDVPVDPGDTEDPTEPKEGHLTITKTVTSEPANGETYALGETITYEIVAENDGNLTLTDVTVTDELTGDEWTIESLEPGASETFTAEHAVTEADILAGSVVNVATAEGTSPDPDEPDVPVDPGETDTPTDPKAAHVTITKTVTSTPANGATYALGETITYSIVAENDGNLTATDVTVTDELTGDVWTIESLAPGESETFTAEHVVTQADIDAGSVVNVATATATSPDPDEPDVPVEPGETETPTEPKTPGLTVTKAAPAGPYGPGDTITYTITVTNSGNVTMTNVAVTDPLTGMNETIASLEPGATQTFTTMYTVTAADAAAGNVTNTATATGTDPDGNPVEQPSNTVTVTALPRVTLTVRYWYGAVGGAVAAPTFTRTYNIALYDDLYYSDGMPVTARDYAFSILLSMAPEVAAIGGQTTGSDYIVGAAAYKTGENAVLSGVRIVNETQFTITISADYLPFFYELALLNYNPYPIHVIAPGCIVADDGEGVYIRNMSEDELVAQAAEKEAATARVEAAEAAEAERAAAEAVAAAEAGEMPEVTIEPEASPEPEETPVPELELPEVAEGEPIFTPELLQVTILDPQGGYLSHPSVVSGPYRLTAYDAEAHVARFERNLMYKGNSDGRTPSVERLVMKPVSPDTMLENLANGEVDLLNKVVNSDVLTTGMAMVAQNESLRVSNYTRSGYSFISFSCEREATGSQAVRQAIAHCLDKDTLVADYVGNYGLTVDGYYGLGQWMYQMVQGTLAIPQETEVTGEEGKTGEADEIGETVEEEPVVLSMENVPTYALDVPAAVALLEGDGWTLNREGNPFDPEVDDVRCKKFGSGEDEHLVPLDLKLIYPEGNDIGEALDENFVVHLAEAGIQLTVEAVPMAQLLDTYYRNVERDVDMIYLATNFATVFDPSSTFNPADAYQGRVNRTGIADEELYQLTVDMRRTEPGEVLEYCQKWVAF